jgi:S-adenosylmethionine-dependent methyltransferase
MKAMDNVTAFDAGAHAWANYNRTPLGRIRHELTWHNLAPCLPAIVNGEPPPRVLDAGGGSGEMAIQLVQRGYRVWLLGSAPAMLDLARQAAETLPDGLDARLSLCLMNVEDALHHFSLDSFDAVTCHTLIEYVSEPHNMLRGLISLLREEGLLSISFVNRHAEVLRRAWQHADPAGAMAGLDQAIFCATLFGLEGTAFTVEEVEAWLADLGLLVTARRGVRVFADYLPRERLEDPAFFDALLRLEKAVAARSPYISLARYSHLIAQKTGAGGGTARRHTRKALK